MSTVSASDLRAYATRVLESAGFGAQDAEACADLLTETALAGIDSHDVFALLPLYAEYARSGIGGDASTPTVMGGCGAGRVVDGGGASGPRTIRLATATAERLARASGIGIVSIRRVGYLGALRWSALPLATCGLVGIVACNAMASEPPALGREPISGTNPLAIAIPHDPDPMVLDMRTDHLDAPARGYGLAVVIDVLTAGLAAGPIGREVLWETERDDLSAIVIAIDPAFTGHPEAFTAGVERLARQVHDTTPLAADAPVRFPGERAGSERRRRLASGVPVIPERLRAMQHELSALGLDREPFPL